MFSKALDEGKEIRVIFLSLINIRNNKGPKMDPCGTPALTVFQDDSFPFIATLCFQLVK
jgi:hypothetical protein